MEVLHTAGIDVTAVHAADGYTPLHRACWGRRVGHAETVRYLIETVHMDPLLPDVKNGKTCWDMTRSPETRAILKKFGAAGSSDAGSQGDDDDTTSSSQEL